MSAPRLDQTTLEFAIGLSGRAGALAAERFFAADLALAIKADGTEVTDADLAVETLIRGELAARFPADEIYGEETGATAGTSGRRWVIDPIDGTKYFAYRIPIFGTNLALEDEYGPALAVINQPMARQLIYAGRGCGCHIRTDGRDLVPVLRDNPDLAAARVELVNPAGWPADLLLTLHRHTRITGHLVLQRQLWRVAALAVVAGAGLVLASAAPV